MKSSRIRMGHNPGDPAPANTFTDFEWVHEHREELLAKYGEGFVIVYEQQVIGFGPTYQQAVDAAERNLPPEVGEITPIVDTLHFALMK